MQYQNKSSRKKGLRNAAGKHIPSQNRTGGKTRHNRKKGRVGLAKGQHLKRRGSGGVQNKHPSGLMSDSVVTALLLTAERRAVGPKGEITFFKKAPVTLRKVKKVKPEDLKRDRSDLLKARAKARSHTEHPVVQVEESNYRGYVPAPTGEKLWALRTLSKQLKVEKKQEQKARALTRMELRKGTVDFPIVRVVAGRNSAREERGFNHHLVHAAFVFEREARKQLIHQCKYPVGKSEKKPCKTVTGQALRVVVAQALLANPIIPIVVDLEAVAAAKIMCDELKKGGLSEHGKAVRGEQAIKSDVRTAKHHGKFIKAKAKIASDIDTARKGHSLRPVPVHYISDDVRGMSPSAKKLYANSWGADLRQTMREDLMKVKERKLALIFKPTKAVKRAMQAARTAQYEINYKQQKEQ